MKLTVTFMLTLNWMTIRVEPQLIICLEDFPVRYCLWKNLHMSSLSHDVILVLCIFLLFIYFNF